MANKSEFRLKGWHVFTCLAVFFGVIFAANGVMVYLAFGSFTGDDVDDAYARGLAYNEVIERREAAKALGWVMSVERDEKAHVLRIVLKDRYEQALSGLDVKGQLRRPVQAREDMVLAFQGKSGGVYEASLKGVAEGQWDLVITAPAPGGTVFEARKRI